MSFWELSHIPGDGIAFTEGASPGSARVITYAELARSVDRAGEKLGEASGKRLGLILCRNSLPPIVRYLAALRYRNAAILLNESLERSLLDHVLEQYRPDWVMQHQSKDIPADYRLGESDADWQYLVRKTTDYAAPIHPDLALLLPTSGTTGSPKMVRLSYTNLSSNAGAIAAYLQIQQRDRAITTLPFNYSYGLSIINSHLEAGATLVATDESVLMRTFWDTFALHQATSFAGVPYTYQILQRLNTGKLPLASLRTLTQAGGRLSPRLIEYFSRLSAMNKWRFFVMYGQTEASPRISYVPPERLTGKIGSIGVAIPGGRLSISDAGELIYEGPNVMMGYAESRHDLSTGDDLLGRLATGDLASADEDGYFYLHGRLKRFIKIHGNRVNLDDIEQRLEGLVHQPVAAIGEDDCLRIFVSPDVDVDLIKASVAKYFQLHPTTYRMQQIEAVPFTASGKKDYGQLHS